MAYDKRLTKTERRTITTARKSVKVTGFRESEKHLNALKRTSTQTVKLEHHTLVSA